ncbi:MAG: hypothetical protein OCC49_02040 [Fibrobacterales bacterium]
MNAKLVTVFMPTFMYILFFMTSCSNTINGESSVVNLMSSDVANDDSSEQMSGNDVTSYSKALSTGESSERSQLSSEENVTSHNSEKSSEEYEKSSSDLLILSQTLPTEVVYSPSKPIIDFDRTIPSKVSTSGYQLLVQNQEKGKLLIQRSYKIKSICWSPSGVGERGDTGEYPQHYSAYSVTDVPLISAMNANTVRTYDAFEQNEKGLLVLDQLYENGIMVIMQVASWYGAFPEKKYMKAVRFFKNHPAILMWQVGNEFNYTNLYSDGKLTDVEAVTAVKTALTDIKNEDPNHPVSVGYGEGFADVYAQIEEADIWSLNIYRGEKLGDVFEEWKEISQKPLHISEYGSDAFDNENDRKDEDAQVLSDSLLTTIIMSNFSALDARNVAAGGSLYAFNDEWWKSGEYENQNENGFPNGGVFPDGYANEEWWGVVDINRVPRAVYYTMQELYNEE